MKADPDEPGLQVHVARSFLARLCGLHGLRVVRDPRRPEVLPDSCVTHSCVIQRSPARGDSSAPVALLLQPCRAVHTLGLRVPIDVVFLGRGNRILKVVPQLPPGRCAVHWRARAVVELPAGYCTGPSWSASLGAALRDSKIMT